MKTFQSSVKQHFLTLVCVLLLAGCASAPPTNDRAELIWADSGRSPVVMDDVRFGQAGNLVRSEVRIRNTTNRSLTLQYKFEWRDQSGFTQSDVLAWQQLNMSPGQVSNVNSVGKTPDSYGFQLTVRNVKSVFEE